MAKSGIYLIDYNKAWKEDFETEIASITPLFGNNLIAFHHIGSTSIPGLAAKPIIDILGVVINIMDVDLISEDMRKAGYTIRGEFGMPGRRFFFKGKLGEATHNLHVYQEGSCEIERHLKFRDYLRTHDEDRKEYEDLKRKLADEALTREEYIDGKDAFVRSIDAISGYEGIRMVLPLSRNEITIYNQIMKDANPSAQFIEELSPFDPIFHLVCYKNTEVVGAAKLTRNEKIEIVVLCMLPGFESTQEAFHLLILQWLKI